jgi:hypothetical protein
MRILSVGLLLMASMAFVLVGCSDNSVPVVAPTDQNASAGDVNRLSKVTQRDIGSFLSTQVTWMVWTGPAPDFPLLLAADFTGVINNTLHLGLPSTFDGSISERALSDGTAEVKIMLRAQKVLTFVLRWSDITLLFGGTPAQIFDFPGWEDLNTPEWENAKGTQTLGDAVFEITFINSAPGDPIPDIIEILTSRRVTKVNFNSSAFGPLTAAAGLGPDGTPGHAWSNQVARFTIVHGHLAIDGCAVENIRLQPVGH